MQHFRIIWFCVYWTNWAIIVAYWYRGSSDQLISGGFAGALVALGRIVGLAAAYMILLQFFLMGRTPWLEQVFGLDRLTRLHHTNGKWGLILLLTHPILLVIGNSRGSATGFVAQFIELAGYEDVLNAVFALVLFCAVVVVSLTIARARLKYESWYFVHLMAYGAVFLSFGHQIANGTTVLSSRIFWVYWLSLYIIVFSLHAVFRFLRPLWKFYKHRFRVSRVVRETHSAISIYIEGRQLNRYFVRPGQFMIFRFLANGLWWQAHPFSLSCVSDGNELRITVKELGDFTKKSALLPQVRP